MTAVDGFPLMLNQEVPLGHGYAAEAFRAEHHDATRSGNGVGSPTALKVQAQPAPDGTIRTNPGGATLKSTYAGQDGQSYHAYFGPRTVPVTPTGSSAGGRTDLVVVQLCDPEHDNHWSYEGEYPIPPEVAKDMEFKRIHVFEGLDRTAHLGFPYTLLAEINRPPNTTIVAPEHITDLRELANPQTDVHMRANNLRIADTAQLAGHDRVFPDDATHYAKFPDFATRMQVIASWNTVRSGTTPGSNAAEGRVQVRFTAPDGTVRLTQMSEWRTPGPESANRFTFKLADSMGIARAFRGQDVLVEFIGRKYSGPNIFMDGVSSWDLIIFFEQELA